MALTDPIIAYNAENNMEAIMIQQYLESQGIEAFASTGDGPHGPSWFGKPLRANDAQVWISRADQEPVALLLAEFEERKLKRNTAPRKGEPKTIHASCENCGRARWYPESLNGTIQVCPYCGSHMDIGEMDWPDEEE